MGGGENQCPLSRTIRYSTSKRVVQGNSMLWRYFGGDIVE